jgi:CubicO group peptidase (beta-lactamase class C family)
MRYFSPYLVALALLSFTPLASVAAEPGAAVELPKKFDVKAIDEYLASEVKEKGFVGASVAILRDGKVVLAQGYGKTALKDGTAVTPDTLFAAGSITKQFTSACILLLAEEGKLSVKDKVSKYYPKLTKADEITLYDLMTHTSGYPDYYPLDFVDRRMEKTIDPDELLRQYAGGELDFKPGTRWSYSNTGYLLLGRVVEKVSGKPFGQFLQERIFKPLDMNHSIFEPKGDDKKKVATGYTAFALCDPEPAALEADGWIHAAGGLFTTPSDLLKWDLALMDGKFLRPESYKLMITPRKLADRRETNYGCGLRIVQREGEPIIQHTGAVSGFLAFDNMLPRTRSAVVLMVSCDHLDAGTLSGDLLTLLLRADAAEAPPVPTIKGPKPTVVGLNMLHQFQNGEIKRGDLGEEFNHYLNDERVKAGAERLKALGDPVKVEVESVYERGGMEVAVIRFVFKTIKMKGLLYRAPDGKVQQFLLYKS